MSVFRTWYRRLFVGTAMVGAMTGLGVVMAAPAGAATFSNESFESPVVAPNTFRTFSAGQSIGAWTVAQGTVDLIGSGFWQAADGVQSLDLNGTNAGAVEQTFDTVTGLKYKVSYKLAGNPDGGPAVKTGQVLANGNVLQGFSFDITGKTRSNMGYVVQQTTFLATGPLTTLKFASTTPASANGPVIDQVAVEPVICGCCSG